ncbi:MAG TPA: hypothetical protein VMG63_03810 [Terriglobia bacterium]|jgi:hypothetical protein|nr:hypothetical protein [Terriglobia bacterium]
MARSGPAVRLVQRTNPFARIPERLSLYDSGASRLLKNVIQVLRKSRTEAPDLLERDITLFAIPKNPLVAG